MSHTKMIAPPYMYLFFGVNIPLKKFYKAVLVQAITRFVLFCCCLTSMVNI